MEKMKAKKKSFDYTFGSDTCWKIKLTISPFMAHRGGWRKLTRSGRSSAGIDDKTPLRRYISRKWALENKIYFVASRKINE